MTRTCIHIKYCFNPYFNGPTTIIIRTIYLKDVKIYFVSLTIFRIQSLFWWMSFDKNLYSYQISFQSLFSWTHRIHIHIIYLKDVNIYFVPSAELPPMNLSDGVTNPVRQNFQLFTFNLFTVPNPLDTDFPSPRKSGMMKFVLNIPMKPIIDFPLRLIGLSLT